jgi:hypothetical protein
VIEGWPVQFLPVASALDAEALRQGVEVEIRDGEAAVTTRVLSAEHVMATALSIGRPKDLVRVGQFVEQRVFDVDKFCDILDRHDLKDAWRRYCEKFDVADLRAASKRR